MENCQKAYKSIHLPSRVFLCIEIEHSIATRTAPRPHTPLAT